MIHDLFKQELAFGFFLEMQKDLVLNRYDYCSIYHLLGILYIVIPKVRESQKLSF